MKTYPPTPELDRMKAVKDQSQVVGEFITWLQTKKEVMFGFPHKHRPGCRGWDEDRGRYNPRGDERCSFNEGEFECFNFTTEKLLAEYFGIDLKKCEAERLQILDAMRAAHS